MKKIILLTTLLCFALVINVFAQTWTAQTSGVTTSLNTVSAVDANVGWIGGNGGVVLRTTNGGTNWTNVTGSPIGTADVYAICGLDANTCLVSTSPAATYVYRTSNGGATWTQVFTQTGGFIDDIKFKDANNGFMYGDPVSSRWSLWKTTNGGVTWDSAGCYLPQAAAEAGWNNAMWLVGNNIWFGTNSTKVYKSTNFGATGSWVSGATTGSANSYSVAFNGDIGFTGQTVALKSTNGGLNYATFTLPGSGTCYSFNTVQGTNRFWYNRGASIYFSSDNGATFTSQFTGTGTYQAMSIVQSGTTIRGWSVTAAGLIAKYDENLVVVPTGTWTEQTSGLTTALYSVSAVNDDIAWIGGASGKVLKTTNKGVNWTNVGGNIPTGESIYCIYGFDANTALATTSPSSGTFIYKTTNGGTNWTTVFSETGGFGDGFAFINANTGFFYGDPVGGRWSLWKTTNAGSNWDSTGLYVSSGSLAGWNNAMFNLGNKIWFGTNGTALPYSSNGGVTWTSQTTPAVNQYAIWFNNDNVGLCGGANINVTTNGGANWSALTTIGTGNVSGIVGVSSSWWFIRQANAVNYSSNNGANWVAQYTAPAGSFYHIALSRAGATIWAVRSNGGISRYGQPLIGIHTITNEVPSSYSLSQNYPNPFNPVTNINFSLPKSGLVTLKVYDALGKEVATLVNDNRPSGVYNVDFDASSLSSGVYFYKLTAGEFTSVKKMMLIK